jgi:hypothetical protein
MSKVRTNSSIEDVDRIAQEEGLKSLAEVVGSGPPARQFEAFNRVFRIEEAPAGKVGIFAVTSTPKEGSEAAGYQGMETHATIRRLFRRAVKWKERVP